MHWQCGVSQMCFSIYIEVETVDAVKGLLQNKSLKRHFAVLKA